MPPPMSPTTRLAWAAAGWAISFTASVLVGAAAVLVLTGMAAGRNPTTESVLADLSIGWLTLMQVPLWAGLAGTPWLARRHGLRWREDLAWRIRPRDAPMGVAAALATQFVAVPLLYWPIFWLFGDLDVSGPARDLVETAHSPFDVTALVLMTVIAAPVSEELFFRGMLQGALSDRLGRRPGLLIASAVFGVVHFQLVQFPALMLVGLVNGLLVMRTGRLGGALVSHATFNAVTVFTLLAL